MNKKFLKKIIAQSQKDLELISALSAGSKAKIEDIKYLQKNKIFILSIPDLVLLLFSKSKMFLLLK